MIAITPPIIFFQGGSPKQATPSARAFLTTRNSFRADFRGWRLDEFSIFVRPPPRGPPTPTLVAGPPPHARPGSRPLSITMHSQPPRLKLCRKGVLVTHLALGSSILSR